MTTESRIDRSFKNLAYFSKEILVECPHCKKRAMVISVLPQYTVPYPSQSYMISKFRCNNCYKPLNEKLWYGPRIIHPKYSRCDMCGCRFGNESYYVTKFKNKIKIKCKSCSHEKFYPTYSSRTYANNHQATDPYLGLPLWLKVPFGTNILWAYNHEHLAYLKEYVGAKLREASSGGKYALAWKLPNFIKIAKNREKILKAIDRLQKRL